MPGALNSLLGQGPPPTPPGGARPIPVQPVAQAPRPPPAAPTSAPATNPLAALLQQQQQAPQKPAPNTAQTVATLVHLSAAQKEMQKVASLPGLGKENVRPEIYEATAELMGEGFVSLPQVMNQIKDIPADPPGQRTWVMTHLKNIITAQHMILTDHAQAFPGTGDAQSELASVPPEDNSTSHLDMMQTLASHYAGRRR